MTTPQQCLESFLKEKAAAYALANARLAPIFAKYFGDPLTRHTSDLLLRDRVEQVFENVKQAGESTTIVTREHFDLRDLRMRYHLAGVGEERNIVRIDWECFLCRRTGLSRGGTVCRRCAREGWYDPRKDKG